MSHATRTALALACTLLAGCAAAPQLPAEFELRQASAVADTAPPELSLEGPQSKASGAAKGAAKGGSVGFMIGGVACMGTGLLAPLCLAAVVPASLGIGAVTGAVVGAVTAASAQATHDKRQLLSAELAQWQMRTPLAGAVQHQSGLAVAPATGADAGTKPVNPTKWQVKIALTELATVGGGPDKPFAVQASARLQLQRAGVPQPQMVKHYQALSATRMTTAEWGANEAAPLRTMLDELQQGLVAQMVSDLTGLAARRP